VRRSARLLTQEPLAGVPVRRGVARWWGAIPAAVAIALLGARAWIATPPLERLAAAASEPADPPGTTAYAGSILVARGGPVIIGFQSDLDARLGFAGEDLRGRGARGSGA